MVPDGEVAVALPVRTPSLRTARFELIGALGNTQVVAETALVPRKESDVMSEAIHRTFSILADR